jgi:hypothetical protein
VLCGNVLVGRYAASPVLGLPDGLQGPDAASVSWEGVPLVGAWTILHQPGFR